MSNEVDVKGINKAELLAALFNNSKPLGLGFLHAGAGAMTKAQAESVILDQGLSFDYLQGRVMKINLEGDTINSWGYDRDNGQGAVAKVVTDLKNGVAPAPDNTERFSKGFDDFLKSAKPTTVRNDGAVRSIDLGVDDELMEFLLQARKRFGNGPKS